MWTWKNEEQSQNSEFLLQFWLFSQNSEFMYLYSQFCFFLNLPPNKQKMLL